MSVDIAMLARRYADKPAQAYAERYDAHVKAWRAWQRARPKRDVTDLVTQAPTKVSRSNMDQFMKKESSDPDMRSDPEYFDAPKFGKRVKAARQRAELLAKRAANKGNWQPMAGKGKAKPAEKPIPRVVDQPREVVSKVRFSGRSKLKVKGLGPWA